MQANNGDDFFLVETPKLAECSNEGFLLIDGDSDGGFDITPEDEAAAVALSLSVFYKKASKQAKFEQRNSSIHSTVYDPSGQAIELRLLLNGKGKLVCWDAINDTMRYAQQNKNGSFTINGLICTKRPLEFDPSLNSIKP